MTPTRIRLPVGAGALYPANPRELGNALDALLAAARPTPRTPKAIVVPHGALRYSGAVAASAFRALRPRAAEIRRVALVGPMHRPTVDGLVVPLAEAFGTPLGAVPVDVEAVDRLLDLPFVHRSDTPHRREHSLEVQLPFLQVVLGEFRLVPILVGRATRAMVAQAIEQLWDGPETVVVVSSDLCQHQPYRLARQLDAATAGRIVDGTGGLDEDCACGGCAIDGLLEVARAHALTGELLDLANSGDAGGDAARVVGYGAFSFHAS